MNQLIGPTFTKILDRYLYYDGGMYSQKIGEIQACNRVKFIPRMKYRHVSIATKVNKNSNLLKKLQTIKNGCVRNISRLPKVKY